MNSKYLLGLGSERGMVVPADVAARVARKTELHNMCEIMGIPFDSDANIDELERKCRLMASGGIPTCVDDLPFEKRAEVVAHIALMNAAGISVTKDDVSALMREYPFQRVTATADEMRETFRQLARASNAWEESSEQRERRQVRNKRKRERRARKGK